MGLSGPILWFAVAQAGAGPVSDSCNWMLCALARLYSESYWLNVYCTFAGLRFDLALLPTTPIHATFTFRRLTCSCCASANPLSRLKYVCELNTGSSCNAISIPGAACAEGTARAARVAAIRASRNVSRRTGCISAPRSGASAQGGYEGRQVAH